MYLRVVDDRCRDAMPVKGGKPGETKVCGARITRELVDETGQVQSKHCTVHGNRALAEKPAKAQAAPSPTPE